MHTQQKELAPSNLAHRLRSVLRRQLKEMPSKTAELIEETLSELDWDGSTAAQRNKAACAYDEYVDSANRWMEIDCLENRLRECRELVAKSPTEYAEKQRMTSLIQQELEIAVASATAKPKAFKGLEVNADSGGSADEQAYAWPEADLDAASSNAASDLAGRASRSRFVPLDQETRSHVTTDCAAFHLMRKEQTLRIWASQENGPIRPIRVNGRLAWSTDEIRRLLAARGRK